MDAGVTTDAGHVSFQMVVGNYREKKVYFRKSPEENRIKRRSECSRHC